MMKRRKYGRTPDVPLERFKTALEALPYVKYAVMFGSTARGCRHARSDYDIAVEKKAEADVPWGIQAAVWTALCERLGLREYDVDIVDFQTAPATLLDSIAQDYVLLKGDEDDVSRLLGRDSSHRTGRKGRAGTVACPAVRQDHAACRKKQSAGAD